MELRHRRHSGNAVVRQLGQLFTVLCVYINEPIHVCDDELLLTASWILLPLGPQDCKPSVSISQPLSEKKQSSGLLKNVLPSGLIVVTQSMGRFDLFNGIAGFPFQCGWELVYLDGIIVRGCSQRTVAIPQGTTHAQPAKVFSQQCRRSILPGARDFPQIPNLDGAIQGLRLRILVRCGCAG